MEILPGKTLENSGKQNPKMGFKSPPEQRRKSSRPQGDYTFNRFPRRSAKWLFKLIASLFANLLSKPQITYSTSLGVVE